MLRPLPVALRKESVDRNNLPLQVRRPNIVALRKESVDRNLGNNAEINVSYVALRKESVDRNKSSWQRFCKTRSRSPQGERG